MCNMGNNLTNAQKVAYALFIDSRNSFMSLLTALHNKDYSSLYFKDEETRILLNSLSDAEKEDLYDILMNMVGKHRVVTS